MHSRQKHFSSKRWRTALPIVLSLALFMAAAFRLTMPGALFLLRFTDTGSHGNNCGQPFSQKEREIIKGDRRIKIRLYEPEGTIKRVIVLVHGIHYGGYDEPRLVHFAKRLAGFGYGVVTPEIEDLQNYDIQARALYDIEQVAQWVLQSSSLAASGKELGLDLFGISFAGGLCLVAAGRPEIGPRLRSVFAFGGHSDLDRTMAYLVTGKMPDGTFLRPHIYGQAVLVRRYAEDLVPPSQVETLKRVMLKYLQERFKSVRKDLDDLNGDTKRLVTLCLKRDSTELGKILEPIVRTKKSDPLLSPTRGSPPSCPVFLLHGHADNVIPPSETLALNRWAARSSPTRALISDLITHVEMNDNQGHSSAFSYWKIIRFWTELLLS